MQENAYQPCTSEREAAQPNKDSHRQADALLLDSNYFNDDATYTSKDFWWRFRMSKDLFMRILFGVTEYDTYFMCKKD
jgi:hypothetical protein